MRSRIVALLVFSAVLAATATIGEAKGESRASIYVTKNPTYDKTGKGPKCNAVLDVPGSDPKKQKAKQTQTVEWIVFEGTGEEACANFTTVKQISLDFVNAKKGNMKGADPIPGRQYSSDRIHGVVPKAARNGLYGYNILFEGIVSEDPELDINGDSPLGPTVPGN